jgi:hypothetical protein
MIFLSAGVFVLVSKMCFLFATHPGSLFHAFGGSLASAVIVLIAFCWCERVSRGAAPRFSDILLLYLNPDYTGAPQNDDSRFFHVPVKPLVDAGFCAAVLRA